MGNSVSTGGSLYEGAQHVEKGIVSNPNGYSFEIITFSDKDSAYGDIQVSSSITTDQDKDIVISKYKTELHFSNGDVYIGELINDKRHGKGVYKWKNGSSYEGDFVDDKANGYGIHKYADINNYIYKGHWLDNKKHGHGYEIFDNGDTYEGNWNNHKMDGIGTYVFKNGWDRDDEDNSSETYTGEFENNINIGNGSGLYKGIVEDGSRYRDYDSLMASSGPIELFQSIFNLSSETGLVMKNI